MIGFCIDIIFKFIICLLCLFVIFIAFFILIIIKRRYCNHQYYMRGSLQICRKCGAIKEDVEELNVSEYETIDHETTK